MKNAVDLFPVRKISLWHKFVLAWLMLAMVWNSPPVLAQVETTIDSTNQPTAQSYPAPVTTPTNVAVNRTVPQFTPPTTTLTFSANPTDQEIFSHSPFEEPLVPVGGTTTPDEDKALAQALIAFYNRTVPDDYSALEGFIAANPQSAWRVALLTDLGWLYRQTGWYSKAMDAWQNAFTQGQSDSSTAAKPIVDRALAELIVLNARVGRMDVLQQLIPQADARNLIGSSKEKVEAAKQALVLMQTTPSASFRCGPMAVEKLRNIQDNNCANYHLMGPMVG